MEKYETPFIFFIEMPAEDLLSASTEVDGSSEFESGWFDEL